MKEKTCCVTGPRKVPVEKMDYVRRELYREVTNALADGYCFFISGFEEGVDQIFMECVIEARRLRGDRSGIFLELAIPYPGRLRQLSVREKALFSECDGIKVAHRKYSRNCYIQRNRYMVSQSSQLIAVYNGHHKGSVAQMIQFALKQNLAIRVISMNPS